MFRSYREPLVFGKKDLNFSDLPFVRRQTSCKISGKIITAAETSRLGGLQKTRPVGNFVTTTERGLCRVVVSRRTHESAYLPQRRARSGFCAARSVTRIVASVRNTNGITTACLGSSRSVFLAASDAPIASHSSPGFV